MEEDIVSSKRIGVIAFYVNVAQMSPDGVKEYLKSFEEGLNKKGFLNKMVESGYEPLFIPNRDFTKVELLKF